MTPLSKAKRTALYTPYQKDINAASNRIQKTFNPDVYVYSTTEKTILAIKPLSIEYNTIGNKNGSWETTKVGTNASYPVAQYMLEDDLDFCAAMDTFIKQARKKNPLDSILLVEVSGIMATAVIVKHNNKPTKGFA